MIAAPLIEPVATLILRFGGNPKRYTLKHFQRLRLSLLFAGLHSYSLCAQGLVITGDDITWRDGNNYSSKIDADSSTRMIIANNCLRSTVPAAAGVFPLIKPEAFMLNPAGNPVAL